MCNDRTPHPVAAMCDSIEQHVAGRERDLIERLAAQSADFIEVVFRRCILPNDKELDSLATSLRESIDDADAYLAEPVKVEIDAAYGEAK